MKDKVDMSNLHLDSKTAFMLLDNELDEDIDDFDDSE